MGIELRNDLGFGPGTPLGYIGRIVGRFELSKLPEIADVIEETRQISRGEENPSTKADSPPPDVYALILTTLRTSIFVPEISNWYLRMSAVVFAQGMERELV